MLKRLNLIRPEDNDIKYKIINFPDGESHLIFTEELNRKDSILIICRICNPNDLFILMQIGDILNRQGITFYINITYLMSMRMDRVITFEESYSLKIVADMINNIKPKSVNIIEPHSNKCIDLINNSDISCVSSKYLHNDDHGLIFPDEGAKQRYSYNIYSYRKDIITCNKVRDVNTGKIIKFELDNHDAINTKDCFYVIDDLCDGGGTFAAVAKEVRKLNKDVKLCIYITHMVNPKGIKTLSNNYNEVYFTNSYRDWQKEKLPDNVKVIQVV